MARTKPKGDPYRYGGHWPLSEWPERYKARTPEPTYPIELSCGCTRRFPAPVPAKGASLGCPLHHENVHVVESEQSSAPASAAGDQPTERMRCAELTNAGRLCKWPARVGSRYCALHDPDR